MQRMVPRFFANRSGTITAMDLMGFMKSIVEF